MTVQPIAGVERKVQVSTYAKLRSVSNAKDTSRNASWANGATFYPPSPPFSLSFASTLLYNITWWLVGRLEGVSHSSDINYELVAVSRPSRKKLTHAGVHRYFIAWLWILVQTEIVNARSLHLELSRTSSIKTSCAMSVDFSPSVAPAKADGESIFPYQ